MSSFSRVAQGIADVLTVTVVDSAGDPIDYSATSPALVAEVWPGSTLAVTFSPAAAWNDASAGTIDVTFATTDTDDVLAGFYSLRVRAADSSLWLWQGFVEVVESPSSTAVVLAPLCSVPYAHAALSAQPFSDDEWQYLPYAIKSASDVIRRWCNRVFTRRDYVETLVPQLDGSVRLREIPVNVVTRVAGQRVDALTVQCSGQANQQARIYFATTGNRDEPGGIAVTGLVLRRVASGVATTDTLLWADYPLVSGLAAAINALGGGWSASATNALGAWATSELVGGETGQGCLANSGGVLQVYSQDLDLLQTDFDTGFVWVGATYNTDAFGPRWGYDWDAWDTPRATTMAPVRVSYNAGYDAIPDSIQSACASLAKQFLFRFRQNPLFKSETAHQYSYTTPEMIRTLSDADIQAIGLYRIHNA